MKEIASRYVKIWWVPIFYYLVPCLLFLTGNLLKSDYIINISLIIYFVNIIGNLVASVFLIIERKWYYSLLQIGVSFFLFLLMSFFFTFSPPDYYGAYKTIPENIKIDKPLEKEPTKEELAANNLILSSLAEPGIYKYYTSMNTSGSGVLYIKAYEITSNDRLSAESIKLRSKVKVEKTNSQIYSGEFTIYEGSWGDKYGARIELWFEPENGNKEYKIAEQNYIVEGWMR